MYNIITLCVLFVELRAMSSFVHLRHSLLRRALHTTPIRKTDGPTVFTNMLAGDIPPPVQVSSVTSTGIQLADGLILPSACIFLDGKVFLWDVPTRLWDGWGRAHWDIFEAVVPKPGAFKVLLTRKAYIKMCRDPRVWNGETDGASATKHKGLSKGNGNTT